MSAVSAITLVAAPNPVPRPQERGYHILYRLNETNHCPGCGRTHWYVGRMSAECAFCGTPLMLADGGTTGAGVFRRAAFEEAA